MVNCEKSSIVIVDILSGQIMYAEFERRLQSDCVHEQVAKADCECPLYAIETLSLGEKSNCA